MKTEPQTLIQIGQAAQRTGLSLRTLRHWEHVGLVQPSSRSNGGFRLYSEPDLERIHVIKSMKPLALTLDEIRELLAVLDQRSSAEVTNRKERVTHYRERTEACISRLERDLTYARELLDTLDETD